MLLDFVWTLLDAMLMHHVQDYKTMIAKPKTHKSSLKEFCKKLGKSFWWGLMIMLYLVSYILDKVFYCHPIHSMSLMIYTLPHYSTHIHGHHNLMWCGFILISVHFIFSMTHSPVKLCLHKLHGCVLDFTQQLECDGKSWNDLYILFELHSTKKTCTLIASFLRTHSNVSGFFIFNIWGIIACVNIKTLYQIIANKVKVSIKHPINYSGKIVFKTI